MKAAETIPNAELAKMLVDEQEKVKALRELCGAAAPLIGCHDRKQMGEYTKCEDEKCSNYNNSCRSFYLKLKAASEGK